MTVLSSSPVVGPQNSKAPSHLGNGIEVGQTKIYDQRMLAQQFAGYQRALIGFSPLFDRSALSGAIGSLQASSSADSQLQVSGSLGTPVEKPDSKSSADSSKSATGKSGGASLGAEDTLAEQTELQFQVLNLQLLLNGSITDRVFNDGSTQGAEPYSPRPRQQVVVGFGISVQPKFKDAVAEVTVQVFPDKRFSKNDYDVSEGDAPALVSLLPQQKTYNVASYTSSNTGFSIGTVFQFLGVSATSSHSSSNLYLARDVDTVAFQGQAASGKNPLTFGWQFRPVLNQSTVQPGLRQVYAAISLPNSAYAPDAAIGQLSYVGKVVATTVWRHYDRKTGIVGDEICQEDSVQLNDLDAYPNDATETALSPHVSDYDVTDAGNGQASVALSGFNFFDGTGVSVGGVPLPATAFARESETHLVFTAPAAKLINGFKVTGPYGETSPIELYNENDVFPYGWKIDLQRSFLIPVDMDNERAHIVLVSKSALSAQLTDEDANQKVQEKSIGGQDVVAPAATPQNVSSQLQSGHASMKLKRATSAEKGLTAGPNGALVKSANATSGAFGQLNISAPTVISIGDCVAGLSDKPISYSTDGQSITLECTVPKSAIHENRMLRVERLGFHLMDAPTFRPALDDDFNIASAILVADAETRAGKRTSAGITAPAESNMDLIIVGANLDGTAGFAANSTATKNYVTVVANGLLLTGKDAEMDPVSNQGVLRYRLTAAQAKDLCSIIVFRNNGVPVKFPVTLEPPPAKVDVNISVSPSGAKGKPSGKGAPVVTRLTITTLQAPQAMVGDLPVEGSNLDQVVRVDAANGQLKWLYDPAALRGIISLTKTLTAKPGPVGLTFTLKDGTKEPHPLMVVPKGGVPAKGTTKATSAPKSAPNSGAVKAGGSKKGGKKKI
ncbi:MAG TPA: hypothetical protein VGL56_18575 [Fimbriimonadaceae bacterium]